MPSPSVSTATRVKPGFFRRTRQAYRMSGLYAGRDAAVSPMLCAMPDIAFLGAAGTVTGSKYLVTSRGGAHGDERVLVDCGMYQGLKELRQRNWEPFPFDPGTIPFVVLTHAHIDHTGLLPLLVRKG